MVLFKIKETLDYIKLLPSNSDLLIKTIIDVVLCLLVVSCIVVYFVKKKKFQTLKLLAMIFAFIALGLVCYICELQLFKYVLGITLIGYIVSIASSLAVDIRHYLENSNSNNKTQNSFTTAEEKKAVIQTICQTASYLSARKIGALITMERNDSLDEYIKNAIDIRCQLTQEIMTTIFTPGTACHDGAIIVRKNIIMCAGAYYPSTLKFDVPKALGSRHRAAIGISEHVDALTVVVSEQTGNISITLDGVIYQNISNETLKEMLESHLLEEIQDK